MTDLPSKDAQKFMFPTWKKISESYSINFGHHDAMKFFLKQTKERWNVVLTKRSVICVTSVSAEYYAFCMQFMVCTSRNIVEMLYLEIILEWF